MGQIDLLEDRFALRRAGGRGKEKQAKQKRHRKDFRMAIARMSHRSGNAIEMCPCYHPDASVRRAQSQFSKAAATVTARIRDLLKSTCDASSRQISTPMTAHNGPSGRRNVGAWRPV